MASTKEIVLEYVCPGVGVVIGTLMFAAPIRDLKAAIDKGDLGTLNPTPWGFMLGNCMGWVLYGTLLKNMWVFFGNAPGLLISIWLNLGAVKLLYQGYHVKEMRESTVAFLEKENPSIRTNTKENSNETNSTTSANEQKNTKAPGTHDEPTDWATIIYRVTSQTAPAPARHEAVVIFFCTLWMIFGTILAFLDSMDLDDKVFMVGIVTNCIVVFFYGAPLSTIFQVLKERHTASIHIPTMILNTLNSSFWCAYGIAIGDFFLFVPNGLGAGFGGIQIFLCTTFPRSPKGNAAATGDVGKKNEPQQGSTPTQKTLLGSSTQIHSHTRDLENGAEIASA